jgi:CO/xanthine dehydrogenase Mo-binding subunit
VFPVREDLSRAFAIPPKQSHCIHAEGAGCYGHNGADDVAFDAALIARAVEGRPVRVQWMRDDEFAWEPYGSAMVIKLAGSVDALGNVVDWRHELWRHPHSTCPSHPSASSRRWREVSDGVGIVPEHVELGARRAEQTIVLQHEMA